MYIIQTIIVGLFGMFALSGFLAGLKNCRKNPWGLTPVFNIIGAFIWTDAVVFGLFWSIVCSVVLILSNWILFLLILSIFWLVRSIGEVIYWLNEQFAVNKRNKPETLWHSKFFPGTSAYVASQIFWQCITVFTIITTIYLVKTWL